MDVEKKRLGREQEKLHIERHRLEMEERKKVVFTAYKQLKERRGSQIDHELFHGAFMQIKGIFYRILTYFFFELFKRYTDVTCIVFISFTLYIYVSM